MRRLSQFLILLVALGQLAGCGFHLRGAQTLPPQVDQVALSAIAPHSLLVRELDDRLSTYQIPHTREANPDPESTVLIRLQPEVLERRLLSVFSTGQVAEYELILGVRYTVAFPGHEPLQSYFEIVRDYQDDPDKVLAKSRELELVVSEMRKEAADRIIRRLSLQASEL